MTWRSCLCCPNNSDPTCKLLWTCLEGVMASFKSPFATKQNSVMTADVLCVLQGRVDVALVCDSSGAGRGGKQQGDVLPPLMPGMKARQQQQ